MDELSKIEKRVKREIELKKYTGPDKVILAEEKRQEIISERANRPPFSAKTGIFLLDECLEGFRKGQLVVLSGPPKNGKSSFCQTLTKRFDEQGHSCLWFSYEMGYEELFEKFPMKQLNFYVPKVMESDNLNWVEDKIVEAKQKFNTDIVFIDHLDFLRDPGELRGNLNMAAYVGGIVQRIKRIAVEQDILIFLMSHITKNNWTSNNLPSPEDLRDSGQIAQLADIVLMIIRSVADKNSEDVYVGSDALVGIMANRHNGKTKKVPITFSDGEFRDRLNDFPKAKDTDTKPNLPW